VCYHTRKDITHDYSYTPLNLSTISNSGYKVHNSVCIPLLQTEVDRLKRYKNYNITINCNTFIRNTFNRIVDDPEFYNQVQLSVINNYELFRWKEYQKLFLIKNNADVLQAKEFMRLHNIGRLHYIIEHSFLNNVILKDLIETFTKTAGPEHSLDTCLSSFIVNGHCPYEKDYIDITYDNTLRSCPYIAKGRYIRQNATLDDLFDQAQQDNKQITCKYKQIFGGINEQRTNSTSDKVQDTDSWNGIVWEHKRRLALRS
jgi:hypothetical protein